jgi:hypothetical protein
MRGLRAKRALGNLERFLSSIGDVSWLPDTYVGSPDALRCHLERLALKAKQGRPVDPIGRLLRRNIHAFVPSSGPFERTRRAASQEDLDEIFTDICAVVRHPASPVCEDAIADALSDSSTPRRCGLPSPNSATGLTPVVIRIKMIRTVLGGLKSLFPY